MRTATQLVTAAAVVIGYIAAFLAVLAGIDLRERNAFHDAPAQVAAFRVALDQGGQTRPVYEWFLENAPGGGTTVGSIIDATHAAEAGELDAARAHIRAIDAELAEDQKKLDERNATSWGRATPWVIAATPLAAVAFAFRFRRRAANADVVALVSAHPLSAPFWRRPVLLVVTGICYALLFGGTLAILPLVRGSQLPWLGVALTALPIGFFGLRYSRPRSARSAAQVLRADERKPVLYLRGFGDDPASAVVDAVRPVTLLQGLVNIRTREEELIGALAAFGPVIAVGQPGERLPRLGAARLYLPGNDWKPGVRALMEQSQLIVLRLGVGEGVWWEVEQARATQPPGKLVLLMPGGREDLAARLDEHLPKPANARPEPGKWTASVIVFDEDWTPRVVAVGPGPGENVVGTPAFYVSRALQSALAGIGVRKRLTFQIGNSVLPAFGRVLLLPPALALVVVFLRMIFLW